MPRIDITTTFVAAIGAGAVGLFATAGKTQEFVCKFRVDCWIGMKLGDQPGQLIRGWICEGPSIPETKAEPVAAIDSTLDRHEEKEEVATIKNESNRR